MSDEPTSKDPTHVGFDEVVLAYFRAMDAGREPDLSALLAEHPEHAERLREFFADEDRFRDLAGALAPVADDSPARLGDKPADLASAEADATVAASQFALRSEDAVGQRVGNYELLEEIGRGGMGVVYKARQVKLDRIVAIKMVLCQRLASSSDLERFRTEAKAAAKLRHPNIVAIHQVGETGGQHFYSMDYIEGKSLAQVRREGPIPDDRAARYVKSIAEAVHYAHLNGILHRDLKPANILIDADDQPHVTDFGLAKNLAERSDLTRPGTTVGTPSYMSPEQAAARPAEVGPASDVYALGAILYVMLAGRPPFRGRSHYDTLSRVLHETPVPPRTVNSAASRDLETICLKCLHKDPRQRYRSAKALVEDLDRFLRGDPILAKPAPFLLRLWHWARGIPLVAGISGRPIRETTPGQKRAQRVILALPLILLAAILGRSFWPETLPSTIRVATGRTGGLYQVVARNLAPCLEKRTDRKVEVLQTSGSVENAELLAADKVNMALVQSSTFSSDELSIVTALYYEFVYVVVRNGEPIERIEDLAGKAVSLGPLGSGMRVSALKLLDYYGVPEDSLTRTETFFTELLTDDSLQAAIVTLGESQSTELQKLLSDPRFTMLPIPDAERISLKVECFKAIQLDVPATPGEEPPERALQTVATPAFLIVRSDAGDLLVTRILEAIYHESDLVAEYGLIPAGEAAEWKSWGLHPAARRFFESAAGNGR